MNKLLLSLTGAAATGALTLVPPAGWSPRVRRAYVVAPGVLMAAGSSLFLARLADRQAPAVPGGGSAAETAAEDTTPLPRRRPFTVRVAVPLCLGLATCGVQATSLWVDAALERGLVRLGATHPRRWMAALAVAASLGVDAAGARRAARTPAERSTS